MNNHDFDFSKFNFIMNKKLGDFTRIEPEPHIVHLFRFLSVSFVFLNIYVLYAREYTFDFCKLWFPTPYVYIFFPNIFY